MASVLVGYFTTMITAFFGLMFLLNSVLSSSFLQQTRQRPHPTPVFAEAVIPDTKPAIGAETARVETPKPVVAETKPVVAETKSARVKIARDQRRKEDLAGRQQDRQYSGYSMALGYAQDNQRQSGGLFDMFGTRRF